MARKMVRAACRSYPLYSGIGAITERRPFAWLVSDLTDESVCRIRGAGRLFVQPTERDGRSIFFFGDLDSKISWIVRRVLRPGDTFLDLGANYGLVTFVAAATVGPTGTVHAFEPQPNLASWCRRSADLNGCRNVHVHEIALSDRDGTSNLFVPPGHRGAGSLDEARHDAAPIPVITRRTSTVLASLDLDAIRLAKIDVEGHEATLLRGGEDFLRHRPPHAVVIESRPSEGPFADRAPMAILREWGYRLYAVPRFLVRPRLLSVDAIPSSVDNARDFVGIHETAPSDVAEALGLRHETDGSRAIRPRATASIVEPKVAGAPPDRNLLAAKSDHLAE